MIRILPQTQAGEDSVTFVDRPITVAAVGRLVIFSQCQKAIGARRRRLWREITEQFGPIVYRAVAVAVEHKKGVVRASGSPGQTNRAITTEVEINAVGGIGQGEAIAVNVYQNRRIVNTCTEDTRPMRLPGRTKHVVKVGVP